MPEPTSSGAVVGGSALLNYFGLQAAAAGAVAAALGFLVLWPKTMKEGFARLVVTILSSTMFGPILVAAVHSRYPDLFASAKEVAVLNGLEPSFGILFASGPMMVVAGLPAWWVLGGIVRWFDKRQDKDAGEMIQDAADAARAALGK